MVVTVLTKLMQEFKKLPVPCQGEAKFKHHQRLGKWLSLCIHEMQARGDFFQGQPSQFHVINNAPASGLYALLMLYFCSNLQSKIQGNIQLIIHVGNPFVLEQVSKPRSDCVGNGSPQSWCQIGCSVYQEPESCILSGTCMYTRR